jgi:hypothetical protein
VVGLDLVPLQMRQFCLVRAKEADIDWLQQTLDRESRSFAARIAKSGNDRLSLLTDRGHAA